MNERWAARDMPSPDAFEATTTFTHVPPLETGDRLSQPEFHRRYDAMPLLRKAELVEGVVYVPSPLRYRSHGVPHGAVTAWLGAYAALTPGVALADNATVVLDPDNEVQPDALLRLDTAGGGRSYVDTDDYLRGPLELIVEVASSSASYDLHDKLRAYRRNGVQEYVVWQVLSHVVDWFYLHEGEYLRMEPDSEGVFRSRVFPGLWLDVRALLDGNLQAVFARVQQGVGSEEHARFVERAGGTPPTPGPGGGFS